MCATAIDHIPAYYVNHQHNLETAAMQALNAHFTACPVLLPTLLGDIINILLFGN